MLLELGCVVAPEAVGAAALVVPGGLLPGGTHPPWRLALGLLVYWLLPLAPLLRLALACLFDRQDECSALVRNIGLAARHVRCYPPSPGPLTAGWQRRCSWPASAEMEAREEGAAEAQEPQFKAPPPRKPIAPPPKFGEPAPEPAAAGAEPQGDDAGNEQAGEQDQAGAAAGSKPPPPRFAAPPPRVPGAANAAKAAAVAAARAAQHATPAQRERMVMEAAANAIAAKQAQAEREAEAAARAAERGEPAAPRPSGSYEPPEWGGPAEGIPYTLDILKTGQLLDTLRLGEQGHYTLGRAPNNDIVLDHPSSSRLHAVIQFRSRDGAAFLLDPGSTHGTYLNKQRIPAGKHVPLRVGDQLRFGESTRLYVLGGPDELMPQEGPSKEERMKQAALKAMAARRERDEQVSKAQMEAALGGGASWGFGEDAINDDEDLDEVDWRAYAATKGLSEKQQKIADKIRKREARVQHLQREIDKIKAKEKEMEELSAGQASTLVRNEQEIDKSMAEMEELEEQLQDSIRDAIGQRKRAAEAAGTKPKKKRRRDSDDEYEGSSDDDTFYDRTSKAKPGAGGGGGKKGKAGGGAKQEEVDAASLCGKKEALQEERQRLLQHLEKEEAAAAAVAAKSGSEGAAGGGSKAAGEGAQEDSLDAFMSDVAVQLESDKVASLKRELADVDAQLARTERLLKIADPDGYFKAGSKAVAAAAERAKRQLALEKQRREAEEKQRQQREAEQAKAEQEFVPEEEEEEGDAAQRQRRQASEASAKAANAAVAAKAAASVHKLEADDEQAGGLQVRQRPAAAPTAAAAAAGAPAGSSPAAAQAQQQAQQPEESNFEKRRKMIAAALAEQKARAGGAAGGGGSGGGAAQDAASKVLADLALLSRARQGAAADEDDEAEQERQRREWEAQRQRQKQKQQQGGGGDAAEEWQPPEGQTEDGRTSLNEKLGY
ncbi:Kanadaptin isoform B [Chlorella sorokiniana]|uniref:Kanadaptin isoform B n=1 Tax=Chlorella sorokiniana TaxID=3076 RepID=A0A2P6TJR6_CHLSO|nr:Kanadaptin isoform B [Chlorella sorokiniana]|eukprot:PRW44332.1 Kanadaptin isoform B [Chlorella sorokiniana]